MAENTNVFSDLTLCVHCRKKAVCRPRRLCWHCFYTPSVRAMYQPTSKYAQRSPLAYDTALASSGKASPTPSLPGTESKIAVLESRAQSRLELFHPQDATVEA